MDFHEAVKSNNLDILKQWPHEELTQVINHRKDRLTPLQIAVKNNHTDMAKFLISQGAKVGLKLEDCDAPPNGAKITSCLQFACDNVNFDMVKYLTQAGALLNMSQSEKHCIVELLMAAIHQNDQDMVMFLAENGIDLNCNGESCWGPLVQVRTKSQ